MTLVSLLACVNKFALKILELQALLAQSALKQFTTKIIQESAIVDKALKSYAAVKLDEVNSCDGFVSQDAAAACGLSEVR